jgi:hypothetical protein
MSQNDAEVLAELHAICQQHPQRQIQKYHPTRLPSRLWNYLVGKCLGERGCGPWNSLNKKELNRLVHILTNDDYLISGRAAFKDEFVTCGGVALSAVNASTLESKHVPHLYFAGEVLDIDGVTGGFNFQAAWTTAHTVATAIKRTSSS